MLEVLKVIWDVIFQAPDPDVAYFIEPVTLMALSAGASALGNFFKGRKQRKALEAQQDIAQQQIAAREKQAQEAARQADASIADALAERSKYGLPPSYNELRNLVAEDPLADLQRQQAERDLATSVDALQSGGARALLGGLNKVTESTADRFAKIAADESARRRAGLQTIGEAESRVARDKFQAAQGDLAFGRQLKEGALAQQGAITDAEAAAASMGVQADLAGQTGVIDAISGGVSDALMLGAQYGNFGGSGGSDFSNTAQTVSDAVTSGDLGGNMGYELSDGSVLNPNIDPDAYGAYGGTFEQGGMIPDDEEKMMIMAMKGALLRGETPGEFSHENNPIDIMQDGSKIGEMTGGEGIVSPEDMGKMEQLAGQGNTPLHKFVRSWFKKINKENS